MGRTLDGREDIRAPASSSPLASDIDEDGWAMQEASMSVRGIDFVDHWVFENVNAGPYQPEGDVSEARRMAEAFP